MKPIPKDKWCGNTEGDDMCSHFKYDPDDGDQAYCKKYKDTLQLGPIDNKEKFWNFEKCTQCQGGKREEAFKKYVPEKCQRCKNWERGARKKDFYDEKGEWCRSIEYDWRGGCTYEFKDANLRCSEGWFGEHILKRLKLTCVQAVKKFPGVHITNLFKGDK
jgi:hypothetical protein